MVLLFEYNSKVNKLQDLLSVVSDMISEQEITRKYRQIYKQNMLKHTEEWLYRNESIDMIYNYGVVSYQQLQLLKKQHGLNLSRVNGLHKALRTNIDRFHIGVTSKFLDYYIGFFTFKKII